MDRGGGSPELSVARVRARIVSLPIRRTVPGFWCGVIFLAATACAPPEHSSRSSPLTLTIGFPEAKVVGAELGLNQLISGFTHEGLTQVTADGRAVPRLAEKWAWEADGLRLRITLRPGVTFHDGTVLTSEIAAKVLQSAVARPGNLALYPFLRDIAAIRTDGERELVLDLSQRSVFLPEELELPLGIGEDNLGTGPFRLSTKGSTEVVLERFDRYYLGPPRIDRVVIRPFDALRTAWASLLRGEVEMVTDVPADAVEFVQNGNIEVISFPRRYQFMVVFNSRVEPFRSPTVRRALNGAVDRQRVIDNVLQGRGDPATGPLWPRHWAYDSTVQPFRYDPEGTISLLEAAGYRLRADAASERTPARLRFVCLLPENFSLQERIGLEIQRQLYEVGVDVQFEVLPVQEYQSRIQEGRFEAILVDLNSGPTLARPYVFWGSAREFRGFNLFGYENPETEQLFQILHTSSNEAAVRSATFRLQRAFMQDPPALFLVWNERGRAVNSRFRVVNDAGRDPLHTIWQWTENTDSEPISTQ